ncbi:hypothetical protein BANRA_05056 [Klebsiella pneumoniae]|nr:hypothetical protein BANRA_05056 [Klebsiella pneumoniae]
MHAGAPLAGRPAAELTLAIMTNLPERSGQRRELYRRHRARSSGKITRANSIYQPSGQRLCGICGPPMRGADGDNIYATSVQGIGLRVKVWLNISGEYEGDTDDFSPDSQVHYIGDVNYLGKPTGLFDYYASTHYPGISAAAGGHRRRYCQQQSIRSAIRWPRYRQR